MSVESDNIKMEPDPGTTCEMEVQNCEQNQPLDCTKQPEFVSIKMEVGADAPNISIKQEPEWTGPITVKIEPIDYDQNDGTVDEINQITPTSNPRQLDVDLKMEPQWSYEYTKNIINNYQHFSKIDNANTSYGYNNDTIKCPMCEKTFASKGNVLRHMALHNRQKFTCKDCLRNFTKQSTYEKHVCKFSPDKKYRCEQCDKRFRSCSNLEQHKRIHLAVKPFVCSTCDRGFAIKANLAKHQGTSRCKKQIDLPITCTVCNKVFQKEFLLKSHLRKHTQDRPFCCELCNMAFKYKSTLIRHMQLHNGLKPYSCKYCGKQFTHAGLMKPHLRVHTGERPYECPICKRGFTHKHNMNRHQLRHAKVKKLTCDLCHKKFPKESRLKYHMITHTKAKPFPCYHCDKKFSHKQNVVRHYERKHPLDQYPYPPVSKTKKVQKEEESTEEEFIIP